MRLGGVEAQRDMIRFADQPLTKWFSTRPGDAPDGSAEALDAELALMARWLGLGEVRGAAANSLNL